MGSGGTAEATVAATDVDVMGREPALHVIVLGSGGGPFENNVTSLLVRSISANWAKGSIVAVDAGVHLGAIKDILDKTQPKKLGQDDGHPLPHTLTTGPFAGYEVKYRNSATNAADLSHQLIDTYLITHCHFDHISGLVINTAGIRRPKRLAALPITIEGFKKHIFNNVIWPNLTDENNGHGLVTYMRLVDGGSPALGEGDTRGYLEIGDGLAVKAMSVSHGHCIEKHCHRGSISTRHPSFDGSSLVPGGVADFKNSLSGLRAAGSRSLAHLDPSGHNLSPFLALHQQADRSAISRVNSLQIEESVCVYDSSAYFFQHIPTGREILIFGDVEPDSESLSPRNLQVWQTAAPKIAAGKLAAIFIECSYDDSVTPDRLYGHMAPRYLQEEMTSLAKEVLAIKQATAASTAAAAAAAAATASNPATRAGSVPVNEQRGGRRRSHPEFIPLQSSSPSSYSGNADKKRKRVGGEEGEDYDDADNASPLGIKRKPTPQPPHQLKPPAVTGLGGEGSDTPISPKTVKPGHSHGSGVDQAESEQQQQQHDYFLHQPYPHVHHHQQQQYRNQSSTPRSHTPHLATPTAELSLGDVDSGILNAEAKLDQDADTSMSSAHSHSAFGAEGEEPVTPLSIPPPQVGSGPQSSGEQLSSLKGMLKGLKVVIIHVKDRLVDGPEAREVIEKELWAYEKGPGGGLGVEYLVSKQGDSLFL